MVRNVVLPASTAIFVWSPFRVRAGPCPAEKSGRSGRQGGCKTLLLYPLSYAASVGCSGGIRTRNLAIHSRCSSAGIRPDRFNFLLRCGGKNEETRRAPLKPESACTINLRSKGRRQVDRPVRTDQLLDIHSVSIECPLIRRGVEPARTVPILEQCSSFGIRQISLSAWRAVTRRAFGCHSRSIASISPTHWSAVMVPLAKAATWSNTASEKPPMLRISGRGLAWVDP